METIYYVITKVFSYRGLVFITMFLGIKTFLYIKIRFFLKFNYKNGIL